MNSFKIGVPDQSCQIAWIEPQNYQLFLRGKEAVREYHDVLSEVGSIEPLNSAE